MRGSVHPVSKIVSPVLTFLTIVTLTSAGIAQAKEKAESKPAASTKESKKEGAKKMSDKNPVVVMETSLGTVEIELFADKAPGTTKNFLAYVDENFYAGTIFHRVMSNFMIQGGGFTETMQQKETKKPITNEANNGLKNDRGTLAMARTNAVDSATAQFFINVVDNPFLNHVNQYQFGYAVFGKVISGLDVVDKIKAVPVSSKMGHENVPVTPVVIKSVKRK